MNEKIPNEPHKAVLRTAVAATILIAVGAFVLSFAALTDLAQRSGIDANLAWIWPIIIDGMIVAATVAIVALNGFPRKAMVYPWSLLFFGAIVSTAANSTHAILTVDSISNGVPPVVSALVAAMPPVVLLAITHLTVHMYQKKAEAAEPADECAGDGAVGEKGCSCSRPPSMTRQLDSGTSRHAPCRLPSGSDTTRRVSSESCWSVGLSGC